MAKKATNAMDLLLGMDTGTIAKPRKEVKMKRLSEILGQDVVFVCEGLEPSQQDKVQENALTIDAKNGDYDLNMSELQLFTVIEGVVEPSLKSKELRDKFGAPTPKELVHKLLLGGEISKLYNVINALSGYGEDSVAEVKNS